MKRFALILLSLSFCMAAAPKKTPTPIPTPRPEDCIKAGSLEWSVWGVHRESLVPGLNGVVTPTYRFLIFNLDIRNIGQDKIKLPVVKLRLNDGREIEQRNFSEAGDIILLPNNKVLTQKFIFDIEEDVPAKIIVKGYGSETATEAFEISAAPENKVNKVSVTVDSKTNAKWTMESLQGDNNKLKKELEDSKTQIDILKTQIETLKKQLELSRKRASSQPIIQISPPVAP